MLPWHLTRVLLALPRRATAHGCVFSDPRHPSMSSGNPGQTGQRHRPEHGQGQAHWEDPGRGSGQAQGRGRGRGWGRGRGRGQEQAQARGQGRGRGRGQGYAPTGSFPYPGAGRGSGPSSSRDDSDRGRQARPGGVIFMQDRPRSVDGRIKDDSDRAVVERLARSDTGAGAGGLPLRPDFGTQGRPIALRANYFPVCVEGRIFRYGAEIALSARAQTKTKLARRVKQRVFRLAEQTADWAQARMSDRVAHDGAEKLVASFQLPQPLTIQGPYYEGDDQADQEASEYTLTLTYVEEVDQELLKECLAGTPVDSQALAKVLSALNLVLTAHASQVGTKIGRDDENKKHPDQRIFFDEPTPRDIGGGLAVREGFYVSVRPAHQQLMVNVNTSHAAFYKPQNFVAAMNEYGRLGGGNLNVFANQVRVETRPKKRVVMIQGVSEQNAYQHKFKHDRFGLISIVEYYKRQHNIKLTHPGLPLLKGPGGSVYPQEICSILPDQGFRGELTNRNHAKKMVEEACKPPKKNADDIVNKGLPKLGFQNPNPVLDSFGVHVGDEMAVVPGRILDKPGISYSAGKQADINSSRASWNLARVKFAVGAQLVKWAVLVIQDGGTDDFTDSKEAQNMAGELRTACNKSGMGVSQLEEGAYASVPLPQRGKDPFRQDAIDAIEQALETLKREVTGLELVVVMLSNDDKAIYGGLKWLCDVKLDISSVCMQSSKVKKDKGRVQYLANIALKVNMKMGGINHTLDKASGAWLKSTSTMVMGMDVTHPAQGVSVEGTPSIVAVVASIDDHFAQYPAVLAIRKSKVEIERGKGQNEGDSVLRDMFISRFELYRTRNGKKLPERVILYRDGVSESQFAQVREYELRDMKAAMRHFDTEHARYEPKLSIVVCGKRHGTRFYPMREGDAAEDGNPLPGTVVDRGVTPAYEFDFFLQPHGSLKGTARPTHYFVVHDENKLKADEIQRATNDLSYMFARATKAVSLVSPAYWADIACERGRCYLHKLLMGVKEGGAEDRGKDKKGKRRAEPTPFEQAETMWGGGVSGPRLRDTMFYL